MAAKTRTNLTSLERLERQLQGITPDRAQGDAWEKALKGWINAGGHPELTKAWMWGEWPGKLKAGLKGDKGVDLVAETRDKQLVAIQVKFRRDPNDPVTAPEVQKLVGSYRKHFTLFALASNAWSATRGVSEAVGDEDAMLILREQLLESNYDWAAKKSIKRTKFTPFPFQKVAAENVRKALAKGGRAQIVMACGTGKTVTMLLAAEALDAQRVLVLAPTLLLVKQLRDEWISKRRPDREWASLAVCSDIGDGVDASEIAPAEFGAPPTTNPDDIAAFLKKPGRRVVFGTYASSDRIAKAQKKAGVPSFDLAVADEAHRIAGVVSAKDKSERSQRVMLEEKEIKAVRRLFATATPRITGSKKTRDGDDILIESMDDESRFGKVAHSVTFQEAVKLKRLVPYKLVVTIVTNDEVADAVQNRRFIDVNGKPYAADEVATAIAIRRAYKDLGISKIISYHSRVAGARAFADLITQVPGRGKSPVTEHVAGSMPVNDRRQVLNRLAAATEPYLVTNARCLTEGIDVPALDAVAFADPRRSQVDIVQAVGRAMRRPIGKSSKTTGYIILPVYLTKKELKDPETAVEGSAFEPVLQVLRALKDHDPFMARFMAKVLVGKGARPLKKGKNVRGVSEILEIRIDKNVNLDLSKLLIEAIQLKAITVTAESWFVGFEALKAYRDREGDCDVLASHREGAFGLGHWVLNQRSRRNGLSDDQVKQLNELGFIWNTHIDAWNKRYEALKSHLATNRNAYPVARKNSTADQLGHWLSAQRSAQSAGTLEPTRSALLEELPGWSWDPVKDALELGFIELEAFARSVGHSRVPQQFATVSGFNLGRWVLSRRRDFLNGTLSASYRTRLEGMPGWVWNARDAAFADGLASLIAYQAQNLHCDVPGDYTDPNGFRLGQWVSVKRMAIRAQKLDATKRAQLESLSGWKTNPIAENWETGFAEFQIYAQENGHGLVPQSFVCKSGFTLGRWVSVQRVLMGRKSLTKDAITRLNGAPHWVWNDLDARWESGFSHLKSFWQAHRRWPASSELSPDGFRIGGWLNNQRGKIRAGELALGQRKKLETLSGWVLDPLKVDQDASWNLHFSALEAYVREFGDAAVPNNFVTQDGVKLGAWTNKCRARIKGGRGALDASQIARLLAMPGWTNSLLESSYEEAIRELKAIAAKGGILSITNHFVTPSGFRLGQWCGVKRGRYKKGKLEAERIAELESIPGWVWDKNEADWQAGYQLLLKWVTLKGTAYVPTDAMFEGFKLGLWARSQRDAKRGGWRSMTPEHQKALESLPGWVWDPPSASGKTGGFKRSGSKR
jgi:superfamily II DNA or RNA helicase